MLIIPEAVTSVCGRKEGYQMAKVVDGRRSHAFVLYTGTSHGLAAGPDAPLQVRSGRCRFIRGHAAHSDRPGAHWRHGLLGGGHLAARLATRFDLKTYMPLDDTDNTSARLTLQLWDTRHLIQGWRGPYGLAGEHARAESRRRKDQGYSAEDRRAADSTPVLP